jgi:DNA-binding response OmpR family regulator
MTKILVVDDDDGLLNLIKTGLEQIGFQVLAVRDGEAGLKMTFDFRPDLIILDLMLPGMDGLEICRRLRELTETPILMLTALSSEMDIVRGLTAGADDYLAKPFGMNELVARINNCLRHKAPTSSEKKSVLTVHDLTIDLARHRVTRNRECIDLSPTEFRLLSYLARNRGKVIPHRVLLTEVWGVEYADQVDYLHLYIRYLRKKVEVNPSDPTIIRTERGVGYSIED